MRITERIPVAAIQTDRLPRFGSRSYRIAMEYARLMEQGAVFPPIKVMVVGDGWRIRDGRHRLLAHMVLGRPLIEAHWGVPKNPPSSV